MCLKAKKYRDSLVNPHCLAVLAPPLVPYDDDGESFGDALEHLGSPNSLPTTLFLSHSHSTLNVVHPPTASMEVLQPQRYQKWLTTPKSMEIDSDIDEYSSEDDGMNVGYPTDDESEEVSDGAGGYDTSCLSEMAENEPDDIEDTRSRPIFDTGGATNIGTIGRLPMQRILHDRPSTNDRQSQFARAPAALYVHTFPEDGLQIETEYSTGILLSTSTCSTESGSGSESRSAAPVKAPAGSIKHHDPQGDHNAEATPFDDDMEECESESDNACSEASIDAESAWEPDEYSDGESQCREDQGYSDVGISAPAKAPTGPTKHSHIQGDRTTEAALLDEDLEEYESESEQADTEGSDDAESAYEFEDDSDGEDHEWEEDAKGFGIRAEIDNLFGGPPTRRTRKTR